MLRDRGPGRSPLDQVETDHVGGAFDEFLEDLRDLSEVGEQSQCRRTLAGANPLESFQGEREIFRMPGKNRLLHLGLWRARPGPIGGLPPPGRRRGEGTLVLACGYAPGSGIVLLLQDSLHGVPLRASQVMGANLTFVESGDRPPQRLLFEGVANPGIIPDDRGSDQVWSLPAVGTKTHDGNSIKGLQFRYEYRGRSRRVTSRPAPRAA